ncbi:DMT family transporter [Amycolatopsis sp. NPDC059090]|uniref:DMT family transporter n=1 Tax=unclassified Amycolatopsis TaxID=2618356 RepID=UPI00366E807B
MNQTPTHPKKPDRKSACAMAITLTLWASAFVGIRYAGADFTPGALALGRLLAGAAGLGAIMVLRREGLPPRTAWPGILGVGFFWFGLYTVALNWGEQHADAGTAALIVCIGPIFLALLSGWLLHEGFPPQLFIGLAIAFAGTAIVGWSSGHGTNTVFGILLCLVAAAGYAIGVTAQKTALKDASALQVTTFGCAVGAVACLPFAGQLITDLATAPTGSTLVMLYLGLFPSALAFYTWAFALSRTTAGRLGTTTYVVPLLVVLLSWLLLSEAPTLLALAGGALSLAGVAISRTKWKRQAHTGIPEAID